MIANKKLVWKPGWNGQAYKGDDWIIANCIVPNRKLTKEEMEDLNRKLNIFKEKNPQINMKITMGDRNENT